MPNQDGPAAPSASAPVCPPPVTVVRAAPLSAYESRYLPIAAESLAVARHTEWATWAGGVANLLVVMTSVGVAAFAATESRKRQQLADQQICESALSQMGAAHSTLISIADGMQSERGEAFLHVPSLLSVVKVGLKLADKYAGVPMPIAELHILGIEILTDLQSLEIGLERITAEQPDIAPAYARDLFKADLERIKLRTAELDGMEATLEERFGKGRRASVKAKSGGDSS